MPKRELARLLAVVLLLGGVTLWGLTTLIDRYAFTDDAAETTTQRH